jgi:hypothetical protein
MVAALSGTTSPGLGDSCRPASLGPRDLIDGPRSQVAVTVTPSDAALASRAHAGEIEPFAALLERYRPSLYAAAIGLLRSREDALDAVQETFVTALVKLGSLKDPAAVGGWLHRVLHNTCLMRPPHAPVQAP